MLRVLDNEVLVQSQIARLPKPGGREVDFLNHWMEHPDKGFVRLNGDDRDVWKDESMRELISINETVYEDAVTSWLTRYVIFFYHKVVGKYHKARCCVAVASFADFV